MRLLHYIEIENFKRFGEKQRIELDHPAVIIGPNNCGKTSAIQALALWSQAFKAWFAVRGNSKAKDRTGVGLNRLDIVSVPVQTTKYFWSNQRVKKGPNENVYLVITVGLEFRGAVVPLALRFHYSADDLVYCRVLDEESYEGLPEAEEPRRAFLEFVASLRVELLYPMSGLSTVEPIYQDRWIGTLMGQGKTAEVLRNLCLKCFISESGGWLKIQLLAKRLFQVELKNPVENTQGGIELYYSPVGMPRETLELATSGRGFQQMLLIFAYLYGHPKSVLLIDEPDAHLEILRQRQMYVLLRDVATENGSQIVLVTHSEVILDEAVDTNLTLIRDGVAEDVAAKAKVLHSLRIFGTENYIRAVQYGHVFYVEGSTDVDMLRALASRLQHPVAEELDERVNTYYVQNIFPEKTLESELDRVEMGNETKPGTHFSMLRSLLPDLKGIAILDSDERPRQDRVDQGLPIYYWHRYEAENYFITPDLLKSFANARYRTENLFEYVAPDMIDEVLDQLILERVFAGVESNFAIWKSAQQDTAQLLWESRTERMKMSDFAEEFFRRLAARLGKPMLMRKGELHRLVSFVDPVSIPDEVKHKLDLLEELLVG